MPAARAFFNTDEMKSIDEEAYVNHMNYWIRFVGRQRPSVSEDLLPYYDEFADRFDKWQIRNVQNRHLPKEEGDDMHDLPGEQISWLKEAGFTDTDLFTKHHLWHTIGGRKSRESVPGRLPE